MRRGLLLLLAAGCSDAPTGARFEVDITAVPTTERFELELYDGMGKSRKRELALPEMRALVGQVEMVGLEDFAGRRGHVRVIAIGPTLNPSAWGWTSFDVIEGEVIEAPKVVLSTSCGNLEVDADEGEHCDKQPWFDDCVECRGAAEVCRGETCVPFDGLVEVHLPTPEVITEGEKTVGAVTVRTSEPRTLLFLLSGVAKSGRIAPKIELSTWLNDGASDRIEVPPDPRQELSVASFDWIEASNATYELRASLSEAGLLEMREMSVVVMDVTERVEAQAREPTLQSANMRETQLVSVVTTTTALILARAQQVSKPENGSVGVRLDTPSGRIPEVIEGVVHTQHRQSALLMGISERGTVTLNGLTPTLTPLGWGSERHTRRVLVVPDQLAGRNDSAPLPIIIPESEGDVELVGEDGVLDSQEVRRDGEGLRAIWARINALNSGPVYLYLDPIEGMTRQTSPDSVFIFWDDFDEGGLSNFWKTAEVNLGEGTVSPQEPMETQAVFSFEDRVWEARLRIAEIIDAPDFDFRFVSAIGGQDNQRVSLSGLTTVTRNRFDLRLEAGPQTSTTTAVDLGDASIVGLTTAQGTVIGRVQTDSVNIVVGNAPAPLTSATLGIGADPTIGELVVDWVRIRERPRDGFAMVQTVMEQPSFEPAEWGTVRLLALKAAPLAARQMVVPLRETIGREQLVAQRVEPGTLVLQTQTSWARDPGNITSELAGAGRGVTIPVRSLNGGSVRSGRHHQATLFSVSESDAFEVENVVQLGAEMPGQVLRCVDSKIITLSPP